ncbi:tay bridge kinase isoform X8 [Rhynchophorus ferrugineus]|uniref:tay bridge kinase isoform X8 n=1 Tax=Rhynchophorus ferrugineus TaxID=354439 RepID=UPI003FCD9194
MEIEVKQRNRRRKRARRMQQELKETNANKANADESETEDVIPKKPPRPPNRRKKQKDLLKEPLCEEDIIDGFSILQFRSYEDLELVIKIASKDGIKRLTDVERPKLEPKAHITNHILVHNNHNGLTLTQDPATSDDSGRASERLTGSSVVSVAPRERDADSSRDRLSDASSRCSSGKGYICDSEGEDDKVCGIVKRHHIDSVLEGSDASSVIYPSVPSARKHEFPGALPPSLPQGLPHGPGSSPVPAPTPPNLPAPSPAPAQQPPHHPPQAIPSAAVVPALGDSAAQSATTVKTEMGVKVASSGGQDIGPPPTITAACVPPAAVAPQPPPPPLSSMPPAAAPVAPPAAAPSALHPSASLDPSGHSVGRTDSPAVATSANAAVAPSPGQYHHSFQPLYAPYAHTTTPSYPSSVPYPTATTTPTTLPPQPPPIIAQPQVMTPAASHSVSGHTTAPPISVPTTVHHPEPPKRALSPPKVSVSPRGCETMRERESYSSVTSLSRSSVPTPTSVQSHPGLPQPPTAVSSSLTAPTVAAPLPLAKPWATPATAAPPTPLTSRLSPAPPRPAPPLHTSTYPSTGGPPLFAPPPLAPPTVSTASPLAPSAATTTNPIPFSAESLFQTNQADMLRRELDNRFLASQDRALGVPPAPYLRTEMHQHQHHHTHVHQHTTSLLPPPAASALFSTQLPLSPMDRLARGTQSSFKDIPKLGGVDSPFYRQGLGVPGYPGYNPGLMGHPGLTTGPTPFVPPNHLPTFQPKSLTPHDPTKPKVMKTGKWNAMHVRVAWEIYHHQQKSGDAKGALAAVAAKPGVHSASDLLRAPSHLFSPGMHTRPPELAPYPPTALSSHRPVGFEQPPHHAGSLFAGPPGHLGKSPFSAGSSISPFTRYATGPLGASTTSPFSVSPFGASREAAHLGLSPLHHDPWRSIQRSIPGFPSAVNPLPPTLPGLPPGPAPWTIKPDPVLEQREREAREERERERLRRERDERERREREEKQRRLEQQQQQERERERREKERRELERRENERREREREMLLHQQRIAVETVKQSLNPPVIRDRSPLRNGQPEITDIRVKEEPRAKEEDIIVRSDPRYHPYLRHPSTLQGPPSALDRSRMLAHTLPPHYPPPASHWPPPTTMASDAFYRYGYNPLMETMRPLDDRAGFYGAYGPSAHHPQLRPKDPSLLHLRGGPGPPPPVHKMSVTPPTDLHKKEEPR